MSSDEAYSAFLNKASDQQNRVRATRGKVEEEEEEPRFFPALQNRFYSTESDEPFEEFRVSYDGQDVPDVRAFGELVQMKGLQGLEVAEWDARGEYQDVVDAVKATVDQQQIRCFEASAGKSTVRYWIVGRRKGELYGVCTVGVFT